MDILEAAGRAGVVLKKVASTKGGEYAGACPGCGGLDRFRVWPVTKGGEGSYWCRGCDKGGDLVQFLVDFLKYEYPAAFKEAGREIDSDYRPAGYRAVASKDNKAFSPRHYEDPVQTWRDKAGELVEKSHVALLNFKNGMAYLARRGIDEAAVKNFKLGWLSGENNRGCLFRPRASWGLDEVLKDNGRKKMLWIPRGFIIPCYKAGQIYRIRIRRPGVDVEGTNFGKYYVLPGSGMDCLAINIDKTCLMVVEAELDAMMIAAQAGSMIGVVALGSAQNKPGDAVFYHLKNALRVLVALDHDPAGEAAWRWWAEQFMNARLWPAPIGKDPGDAFQEGLNIKDWITAGMPPVAVESGDTYTVPADVYPIDELSQLLDQHPIKIKADKDHAQVLSDPKFKRDAILNRVKELFFKDDEVHWYLRLEHPDTIIDGDNCGVQKHG